MTMHLILWRNAEAFDSTPDLSGIKKIIVVLSTQKCRMPLISLPIVLDDVVLQFDQAGSSY
jgi:hypothetical protein